MPVPHLPRRQLDHFDVAEGREDVDIDAEIDGVAAFAALRGIVLEIILAGSSDGIRTAIPAQACISAAFTLPPGAGFLLSLAEALDGVAVGIHEVVGASEAFLGIGPLADIAAGYPRPAALAVLRVSGIPDAGQPPAGASGVSPQSAA